MTSPNPLLQLFDGTHRTAKEGLWLPQAQQMARGLENNEMFIANSGYLYSYLVKMVNDSLMAAWEQAASPPHDSAEAQEYAKSAVQIMIKLFEVLNKRIELKPPPMPSTRPEPKLPINFIEDKGLI